MASPRAVVGASLRRHLTAPSSGICSQCRSLRNTPPSQPSRTAAAATTLRWQSTVSAPQSPLSPAETTTTTTPLDPPTPAAPSDAAAAARPKRSRYADHAPHPHVLRAGIILTRPPLLTRTLTPFEEAFFFYQKRLNDRLTMPFVKDVYYPKKSPARLDFMLKLADRDGVLARDLGFYRGRGARDQWDDEILVGDGLSKSEHIPDVLVRDAVARVSEDAEIIPVEERAPPEFPLPRRTPADAEGDMRRLDRELEHTLYLLVQRRNDGAWEFPTVAMQSDEALHEAAQRALTEAAGVNMNTWVVGHAPVAHIVTPPTLTVDGAPVPHSGSKTFFMKGRIMAGQADLADNPLGYENFRWVTREQAQPLLGPSMYRAVRRMMPTR
jgi:large subunit ribosomal protein L46